MLLIKNGQVIDPASKTDAPMDVLLDGSKRLARGGNLPRSKTPMFSMQLE